MKYAAHLINTDNGFSRQFN